MHLFWTDGPASTSVHRQPAYKIVLAMDGTLRWQGDGPRGRFEADGAGVLIPPETPHRVEASGPHLAFVVEPWFDGAPDTSAPMIITGAASSELVSRIRSAFLAEPASAVTADFSRSLLTAVRDGLSLSPRRGLRPEVHMVAEQAAELPDLQMAAGLVTLSATRLRELFRSELGVPLSRLRSWQRLWLVGAGPRASLADRAVRAGFSDQAHMTRTFRSFTGRTPGQLMSSTTRPTLLPGGREVV